MAVEDGAGAPPDASKVARMEATKPTTWADGRTPARQCTAHRTNGEPCKKAAINGSNVCRTHGGAAGQVKRAARARLENAADRMAKELLGIATDEDTPEPVKLAAIKDALDRAGVSAKTAVEIEVTAKPYEAIVAEALAGGSRAESRAARGLPDERSQFEEYLDEALIVDAEIVEDEPTAPANSSVDAPPDDEASAASSDAAAPYAQPSGLMSVEDALETLHNAAPPPAPGSRIHRKRS